ncbi:TMEM175 family protein [uncultured Jatrophihabitans sp.]|uniref:TMEM175 family protein n=1 Tax=uncultured Jatrophihabitans sp. TaxID=1610747 RepID=UPI0035C9EDE4
MRAPDHDIDGQDPDDIDVDNRGADDRGAKQSAADEDQLLEAGAERATVLTDGVVAIALTLLALDLKPDLPFSANSRQLAHFLHTHLTQYIAFALAFYLIAQYWMTHHRMMRTVRRATARMLVLTLVFLFGITLVPLTTYLNGNYGNPLANTLFAANIGFISVLLLLMSEEIHRNRLDDRVESADDRLRRRTRSVMALLISGLVAGMSWVVHSDANFCYLLFIVADVPADRLLRRRARRRRPRSA